MNYIINPLYFYLLNICDDLNTILTFFIILASFSCILFLIGYILNKSEGFEKEAMEFKKLIKITFIINIIFIIIVILVPNSNTLKEMMIASITTKENINLTIDKVREAFEYIINIVEGTK